VRTLGDNTLRSEAESERDLYFSEQAVKVDGEDVKGLKVVLEEGVTIRGRVLREDGKTLPSPVRVWAEAAAADPTVGIRTADVDLPVGGIAAFRIQGLRPGEYIIRAAAGALQVKSISANDDIARGPIEVKSDGAAANVVIVLTERSPKVSGTIRETDGRIPDSAAVIVFPFERAQWTHYGFSAPRMQSRVSFGPEGYQIQGLPAGDYYIIAVDSRLREAWRSPSFLEAAARHAHRLTLASDTSIRRDLIVHRGPLR
jgi:hypothetical protein